MSGENGASLAVQNEHDFLPNTILDFVEELL
jgi:hypothetical protein